MKDAEKKPAAVSAPSESRRLSPAVTTAILVLLGLIVLTALWLGGKYCLDCLYFKNSAFLLTEVEIKCKSPVVRTLVENTLAENGVVKGQTTLPEASLAAVRNALKDDPRIEEVTVTRQFPERLTVAIRERIAVAILRFHPRYGHPELKVDANGVVLPLDCQGATQVMPTLNGLGSPDNYLPGVRTTDQGVLAFLAFLKESALRPEGNMYDVKICRVDAKNETLTLQLEANGPFKPSNQLVLPMNDIKGSLDRIDVVVTLRQENNETISYLNATYENIPVRP